MKKVIINNTTPEFNKSVAKDLRDSVREAKKQTEEKKLRVNQVLI